MSFANIYAYSGGIWENARRLGRTYSDTLRGYKARLDWFGRELERHPLAKDAPCQSQSDEPGFTLNIQQSMESPAIYAGKNRT